MICFFFFSFLSFSFVYSWLTLICFSSYNSVSFYSTLFPPAYNSIAADQYFTFFSKRESQSTSSLSSSLDSFKALVRSLWSLAVLEELSLQVQKRSFKFDTLIHYVFFLISFLFPIIFLSLCFSFISCSLYQSLSLILSIAVTPSVRLNHFSPYSFHFFIINFLLTFILIILHAF